MPLCLELGPQGGLPALAAVPMHTGKRKMISLLNTIQLSAPGGFSLQDRGCILVHRSIEARAGIRAGGAPSDAFITAAVDHVAAHTALSLEVIAEALINIPSGLRLRQQLNNNTHRLCNRERVGGACM